MEGRHPGATPCQRWNAGYGCDRANCFYNHLESKDILNECHKFQRGSRCATIPCYRIHCEPGTSYVPPSSSSSSSNAAPSRPAPPPPPPPQPVDVLLAAVRTIIDGLPQADRCRAAKRLLKKFHDDHTPDVELQTVFLGTVLFLTDIVNMNR